MPRPDLRPPGAGGGGAPPRPDGLLEYSCRIAVTGHRDITDAPAVHAAASGVIAGLTALLDSARHEETGRQRGAGAPTPLALRCLSALAEGADRIVADAFVASSRGDGWRRQLWVPLPYAQAEYRALDCASDASRQEFDALAARAMHIQTLHTHAPADARERDSAYADVGRHLLRHCDLLLAVWDGARSDLSGGSGWTVELALDVGVPVIWIPVARGADAKPDGSSVSLLLRDQPGADPIVHPWAEPVDDGVATVLHEHFGRTRNRRDLLEALRMTDRYNRVAQRRPRLSVLVTDTVSRSVAEVARASASADENTRQSVCAAVALVSAKLTVADVLAGRFERLTRRFDYSAYALAVIAVGLGALEITLLPRGGWPRLIGVGEAAALLTLLVIVVGDFRQKLHERWADARAIAEHLRTRTYTCIVSQSAARQAELEGLVRMRSWTAELDIAPWFAPAVEEPWEDEPTVAVNETDFGWIKEYLLEGWLADQRRYHRRASTRHERRDRIYYLAVRIIFAITLAIVLVRVAFAFGAPSTSGWRLAADSLAFAGIVLTSVGSAVNSLAARFDHGRHHRRSIAILAEVARIQKQMSSARTLSALQELVPDLRRVMLGEATEWLEAMYGQTAELPT